MWKELGKSLNGGAEAHGVPEQSSEILMSVDERKRVPRRSASEVGACLRERSVRSCSLSVAASEEQQPALVGLELPSGRSEDEKLDVEERRENK